MKKKKTAAILLLGMAAVLGTCGIFYKMFRKKESAVVSAREGDVTRYEWMEMLCEQTGGLDMGVDSDFRDIDGGTFFALLPEERLK